MCKFIPLTQDAIALVDDEDHERAMQFKWMLARTGRGDYPYAARQSRKSEGGMKRMVYLHRFILDAQQGQQVDHINGDTLDCRRSNLRLCTHAENLRNKRKPINSTNPYKGVTRSSVGTFNVRCSRRYVGTYVSPEEAARAYDQAAREMYGEFANVNFPDETMGPQSDPLTRGHASKGKPGNKTRAKLSPQNVIDIRSRRAAGERADVLADEFGLTRGSIYHMCSGRTWKDVAA